MIKLSKDDISLLKFFKLFKNPTYSLTLKGLWILYIYQKNDLSFNVDIFSYNELEQLGLIRDNTIK